MDEFHLLEDNRLRRAVNGLEQQREREKQTDLTRLASSKQQHLDLVLSHHTIPLQLSLDLVVLYQRSISDYQHPRARHHADKGRRASRTLASSWTPLDCMQPIYPFY
jgi:hypothetical protein